MKPFSVLLAAALLAAASVSAAAETPIGAADAKALFEAKCSRCHPLDRATRKIKDHSGWQKTVERMKGYAAGAISDAEAQAIVEHLSRVRGSQP